MNLGFSENELEEIYSQDNDVHPKTQEGKDELFAEEVKSLTDKVVSQAQVIREQDHAIIMLKEYVIKHGLPAFWEPMSTLKTPIHNMTKAEIIDRNRESGQYRRAVNPEAKVSPTGDELLNLYKSRLKPPEPELAYDDDVSPFAMDDED